MTKVFTGVALARLVTLGAVTAAAPVRDVIDADLSGGLPASVTFEALVSHTAGLPEYPDNLLRPDAGSSPLDIGYGLTIEHRDAGVVYLKAGNTPSYGAFIVVQTAPPVGVAVLAGCGQPYPVGQVALDLFEAVGGAPR